jgi:hypothetical protein
MMKNKQFQWITAPETLYETSLKDEGRLTIDEWWMSLRSALFKR